MLETEVTVVVNMVIHSLIIIEHLLGSIPLLAWKEMIGCLLSLHLSSVCALEKPAYYA